LTMNEQSGSVLAPTGWAVGGVPSVTKDTKATEPAKNQYGLLILALRLRRHYKFDMCVAITELDAVR
jgi:hypothetical protein